MFSLADGGILVAKKRIKLEKREERREFSIIFHELWTESLGHIGGSGALLYCYLKYLADYEVPEPYSAEWEQAVCLPLGMSINESHAAWAKLQERGLMLLEKNSYVLCDPRRTTGTPPAKESNVLMVEVEARFGRPLSMTEIGLLGDYCRLYDESLVRLATEVAVEAGALSLPYIRQVLLNWKAKGIVSATQAESDRVGFQEKKAKRNARTTRRGAEPPPLSPALSPSKSKYDETEIILRRIKKSAGDEVRHGN